MKMKSMNFLPVLDKKKKYEGHQKLVTPQQQPINLTSHLSYYFYGNSSSGILLNPPRKIKS